MISSVHEKIILEFIVDDCVMNKNTLLILWNWSNLFIKSKY